MRNGGCTESTLERLWPWKVSTLHALLEMSQQWKATRACACMYLLTIAILPGAARFLQTACRVPLAQMRQHNALQDTGDTRETPAIDVCHGLIADDACLCIYDPQVSKDQIYRFV